MARELRETARNLEEMATQIEEGGILRSAPPSAFFEERSDSLRRFALRIYRHRRQRAKFFASNLFGEACWDMMLAIYCDQIAGKSTTVTSACIAADVPTTTGLRYIQFLTDQGLMIRRKSTSDGRKAYLSLSDEAMNAMHRTMQAGLETMYGRTGAAALNEPLEPLRSLTRVPGEGAI